MRTGRISGHIYRADTGAALPDVVVTAQRGSGAHWSARSAKDGSYSIDGLPADSYWVGAYREGFVGSFYGNLNGSPGTKILPGGAAGGVDFRLSVQPRITPIPDKAFVAAYGNKRQGLDFAGGRFSPGGTLLALIVSDINIGEPEQAWLYNLRSQQMTAVSEAPRADRSPVIEHYAWDEDGTFYIRTDRSIIAATETTQRGLPSLPNHIAEEFQDAQRSTVSPFARVVQQYGRFTVFAENFGHGDIHLRLLVEDASKPVDISQGSWELESFILDVPRSRVLYPNLFRPRIIFTFDLNTRKEGGFPLQTGHGIRLLDENRSGTLVAYSVKGSCEPDESLKEGILLRFKPNSQKPSPRHACLVTAP